MPVKNMETDHSYYSLLSPNILVKTLIF